MAIDRADWHWDSTEKQNRTTHGVKGELTEEQYNEIWLLAANHIGLFLQWVIDKGFEGEEADPEGCEKVRKGEMTGTEYLLAYCDGKLWDDDIREDVLPFVKRYYGQSEDKDNGQDVTGDYLGDYVDCCCSDTEHKPVYGVISGSEDYAKIKVLIEEAFARFQNQ